MKWEESSDVEWNLMNQRFLQWLKKIKKLL